MLINKALIEIPPKFANRPPISLQENQLFKNQKNDWKGAHGLAEDIRYYGKWMRDEAEKRIGHLYPKAKLPDGSEATVIAWIWARAIQCTNPACGMQMPLVRSFILSKKKGREVWAEPEIDWGITPSTISFVIKTGSGKIHDGTISKQGAVCIACGTVSSLKYVRVEAQTRKMQTVPFVIVAEGPKGRLYLPFDPKHETIAKSAHPLWQPEELVTTPSHDVDRLPMYGMYAWGDAFTSRQLVALTTLSDLVQNVHQRVLVDAHAAGLSDTEPLHAGGNGALAYADAVATYIAIAIDKDADYWSSVCSWHNGRDTISHTFTKQALQMVWDFAEANPFSESSGNFIGALNWVAKAIETVPCQISGYVKQRDATTSLNETVQPLISTDPPYWNGYLYECPLSSSKNFFLDSLTSGNL